MDLANQQIAIRERSILEILDLSLAVVRAQAWPLLLTLSIGIVPALFLNREVLADFAIYDLEESTDEVFPYCFSLLLLTAVETPLVTALATLVLGRAMFGQSLAVRSLAVDLRDSLPQLFVFQILVRPLTLLICFFFPILPYLLWPYSNEIVLLERNPLFAGRAKRMTTVKRLSALHGGQFGEIFSRWIASILFGALLVASSSLALWATASQLAGQWHSPTAYLAWYLPIALWTVVGFFTVVRFLAYLDLRIRREGWEVDVTMRAEAIRLAESLSPREA